MPGRTGSSRRSRQGLRQLLRRRPGVRDVLGPGARELEIPHQLMPLARTYDAAGARSLTTVRDGYLTGCPDGVTYRSISRSSTRPPCHIRMSGCWSWGPGRGTHPAFLAAAEAANGHVWSCDIADVTRYPEGMLSWSGCPGGRSSAVTTCTLRAGALPPRSTCSSWTLLMSMSIPWLSSARTCPGSPRRDCACFTTRTFKAGAGPPEGGLPRGAAGAGRLARDGTVLGEQAGHYGLGVVKVPRSSPHPRGSIMAEYGTAVDPRLLELLESGGLDWDNPRHREAYLRAWVNRPIPEPPSRGPVLQPGDGPGRGGASSEQLGPGIRVSTATGMSRNPGAGGRH